MGDKHSPDHENPQCAKNWIEKSRFIAGQYHKFYVNMATGEERMVKQNFFHHRKSFGFSPNSLGLLGETSELRQKLTWFVTWPVFDNFILFTIILNSVLLAVPDLYVTSLEHGAMDESAEDPSTWVYMIDPVTFEADPAKANRNFALAATEWFFTVVFTLECILKVIAMGFIMGDGAYLRDGWNWLDFIVVVAGVLNNIPGFPSISILRTIRVLRPLRSLSTLPGLRNLITTLLESIPALMNVLTLLFFIFAIFGILAVQLWGGIQEYRCRLTSRPLKAFSEPLLFTCTAGTGALEEYSCEPKFPSLESTDLGDGLDGYECSSLEQCVYAEHFTLMDQYFGAVNEDADPSRASLIYVSAILRYAGTPVMPWCSAANTNMCYEAQGAIKNEYEKTCKDCKENLWATKGETGNYACFWPIYNDGRVCRGGNAGFGTAHKCGWHRLPTVQLTSPEYCILDSCTTLSPDLHKGSENPHLKSLTPIPCGSSSSITLVNGKFDFPGGDPGLYLGPLQWKDGNADTLLNTYCESNYDYFGNPRFSDLVVMQSGHWVEDLAFGFTRFNDIRRAFITIFQCITEEGWTDVMYQVMDAFGKEVAVVYFNGLIIVGSFFCLNLTLAVIWEQFTQAEEAREQREMRAMMVRKEFNNGVDRMAEEAAAEAERLRIADEADDIDLSKYKSYFCCGIKGNHGNHPVACFAKMYGLVESGAFEAFIVGCILLNTVTLSMDKYPENKAQSEALEYVNFMLTIIFFLEMVLKLIGLGLRDYVDDRFNQFDAFIVTMSIVETILSPPSFFGNDSGGGGGALSALRTFRLFRLFKLARSWKSLQHLLATMVKTLGDIVNFVLLLLLFMYIFALVGMQFFANRLRFGDDGRALDMILQDVPAIQTNVSIGDHTLASSLCSCTAAGGGCDIAGESETTMICLNADYFAAEVPRSHFDTLLWAFTTIFQILSGENWNTVMYDCWRAQPSIAVLYFLCLMVMGVMIVLELFVAILLGNFEGGDEDEEEEEEEAVEDGAEGGGMMQRLFQMLVPSAQKSKVTPEKYEDGETGATEGEKKVAFSEGKKQAGGAEGTEGDKQLQKAMSKIEQQKSLMAEEEAGINLQGKACFILPADSAFRNTVAKVVLDPKFDYGILCLIVISSLMLAIESPFWDPKSTVSVIFFHIDIVMTSVFTLEMLLKMITLGIILHKGSYLRAKGGGVDWWNALDFVIVIVSLLSLAASGITQLKSLRSLRTLRVLRPLRLVNRYPGLKLVVNALLASGPKIVDVLVVCVLFFLIFAIIGINYFKGRLAMCDGEMIDAEVAFLDNPDWAAQSLGDQLALLKHGSPFATLALGTSWWLNNTVGSVSNSANPTFLPAGTDAMQLIRDFSHESTPWSHWVAALASADSGSFPCALSAPDTECTKSNTTGWGCTFSNVNAANYATAPALVASGYGANGTPCSAGSWQAQLATLGQVLPSITSLTPPAADCVSVTLQVQPVCAPFGTNPCPEEAGELTRDLFIPNEISARDGESAETKNCHVKVGAGARQKFKSSKEACDFLSTAPFNKDVAWDQSVPQSFNDIWKAMSCLFEMSTTEGWVDIMWAACDATGIDMQPSRDVQQGWVFFYIAFIVVGSFFVLNLFVGVVCDTFNEMRAKFGGSFLLSDRQKEWVSMRKKINKLGPIIKANLMSRKPTNPLALWCYNIATHNVFEIFIMSCICFNTLIMALKIFGEPTWWSTIMLFANYIFAAIFTVEAVIKLVGLGRRRYFMDSWNCFDFIVVCGTNGGLLIKWSTNGRVNVAPLATVIRTFRVCRIVRLVQSLKNLRTLINTLLVSLPSLFNIAVLLLLMFFIFAVMGVQQFALVAKYDAINDHAHFQDFFTAFITLARSSTGENWNGMMYALATDQQDCVEAPKYDRKYCEMQGSDPDNCISIDGCGTDVSYVFWLLFTTAVTFVVLNVFVAVILEAFDDSADEEEAKLSETQWVKFCNTWCQYVDQPVSSVQDAFKIDMNNLLNFFKNLEEPMGFKREDGKIIANDKTLEAEIQTMDIQTVQFNPKKNPGLYAEFSNVAVACAKRVMIAAMNGAVDADTMAEEFENAEKIEKRQSGRDLNKKVKGAQVQLNAKQYFAALRIACAFRSHKFREKIKERVTEDQRRTNSA